MDEIMDDLLDEAEAAFDRVVPGERLEIGRERRLYALGQRLSKRYGSGTEILGPAEFIEGVHERKHISARLSMKCDPDDPLHERSIVNERELDALHRYGVYVDNAPSMDYQSDEAPFSKKHAALICALTLAADLGAQEESLSLISEGRFHRARGQMMRRIAEVFSETLEEDVGESPEIHRNFRAGDSIVWFSDFLPPPGLPEGEEYRPLDELMEDMESRGIYGFFVMVLDPEELRFNFSGRTEFLRDQRGGGGEAGAERSGTGLSGKASIVFDRAEAERKRFLDAMRRHIETVQRLCEERGFAFVLQPSNKPPEDVIHNLKNGQDDLPRYLPEASP